MNSTHIIKIQTSKHNSSTNETQSKFWTKYSKSNPNKNSLITKRFKKWTQWPKMTIKCSWRDGMHSKTLVSIIWIISLSKIKIAILIKNNLGLCISLLRRSGLLSKGHLLPITLTLFLSTYPILKKPIKSSILSQSLLITQIHFFN